jgi:hypothetical protein
MRRLFLFIDETLRRRQQIEEFCDDADCVLRIKRCRAPRSLPVERGAIPADAEVLELHLWNEHVPRRSASVSSLAWAAKGQRALVGSLAKLARHVEQRDELRNVTGIFGITTLMSPKDAATADRLLTRLGFAHAPYRSRFGAFGDFWENLHVWFLYRTFCRGSGRKPLSGLRRRILWMSKEDLLRRYPACGSRTDRQSAAGRARSPVTVACRSTL